MAERWGDAIRCGAMPWLSDGGHRMPAVRAWRGFEAPAGRPAERPPWRICSPGRKPGVLGTYPVMLSESSASLGCAHGLEKNWGGRLLSTCHPLRGFREYAARGFEDNIDVFPNPPAEIGCAVFSDPLDKGVEYLYTHTKKKSAPGGGALFGG